MSKRKVTKRSNVPQPLPKESKSEYRVRVVRALLESSGPIAIDELTAKYTQEAESESKENVRDAVDTLEKRGLAKYRPSPEDKRVRLWEAA